MTDATDPYAVTADELRQFIERYEQLEAELFKPMPSVRANAAHRVSAIHRCPHRLDAGFAGRVHRGAPRRAGAPGS